MVKSKSLRQPLTIGPNSSSLRQSTCVIVNIEILDVENYPYGYFQRTFIRMYRVKDTSTAAC